MKILFKKEKIMMFLKDYYFGLNKFITFSRLFSGPLLIFIGIYLYNKSIEKFPIAYSGICIMYGIYVILKPYLWILFRQKSFKSENIDIKVTNESILVKDDKKQSDINFESFIKIIDKKDYILFVLSMSQRLRVPKRFIESNELEIIKSKKQFVS